MLKLYVLSQEQFDDQAFNTKLERAQRGSNSLWEAFGEISKGFSAFIAFSASLFAVLIASPLIGLIMILSVVPTVFLVVKINHTWEAVQRNTEPDRRIASRSSWMLTDTRYMVEIRLMNAFKNLIKFWRKYQEKADNTVGDSNRYLAKLNLLEGSIRSSVNFGANIYFFRLLLNGMLGLEGFIFLRSMIEETARSADMLATSGRNLHEFSINLKNFNEIYKAPASIATGKIKIKPPLKIEFDRVSFNYPSADLLVLDDVSFRINPGSKLALVGENGAGKTTIIKLLLRQYLPTKGSITVNGTNIRDIEPASYYTAISSLSQEFLIIDHLTVKDNLLIGLDKRVSDRKIRQATDLTKATQFIDRLPQKFNTRLNPSYSNGIDLSGGQKQRLAIARACLGNGDLIILDEPTSAIDATAERLIFDNIYRLYGGKTILSISHRFNTVRKADKIIVLSDGKIVEQGSHQELMDKKGLYERMFQNQAEGYQ